MQWQDNYNVGVGIIDDAHRQLFSIVRKLTDIMNDNDREKNKRACAEGIKYFKSYTLEHFEQEEEYMRSIAYTGYPAHRRIHEEMRAVTLPALEKKLIDADYSNEAVAHFIGACISWLTVHIMVEDQAITGRVASRVHHHEREEDKIIQLANVVSKVMEEVFAFEARLISKYYSGGSMERPVCLRFRLIGGDEDGGSKEALMALEQKFVLYAVGGMLGVQFPEINNIVLSTIEQLIETILYRIGMHLGEAAYVGSMGQPEVMDMEQLEKIFKEKPPQYSLLLETDKGCFSLSID